MPISQELVLDYSELYNKKLLYKTIKCGDYQDIYQLLPKKTIQKLQKTKLFLVGCGALGCEYLKYFAMLNMCTKKSSKLFVTDMDHIEL